MSGGERLGAVWRAGDDLLTNAGNRGVSAVQVTQPWRLLNFTLLEIGVALMLIPLGKGVGNRTMSIGTGWLRALGRWSYEIYLFHMLPVIGLIFWIRQSERSGYTIIATYLVMLLASIALGFLVLRYFSEPLNRKLRGHPNPRQS